MGSKGSAGQGSPCFMGSLAALFTIIVWGTTFISTKVLFADFSPVEILFFRFVMGFGTLLLAFPRRLKTSVYIYMVPVIAVVASALVLKEPMTWVSAVGTVMAAVGLTVRTDQRVCRFGLISIHFRLAYK